MMDLWGLLRNRIIFFQCINRSKCHVDVPSLVNRHAKIIDAVRRLDKEALSNAIIQHLDTTLRLAVLPLEADIDYAGE